MEEDKEVPMHKHILCKTRTGTIKEFDVDRCYEQFGFYVGDRVHTPKGPAFVVGVQNGQLYFIIDGDKGASKWKDCFRSDFPQRGFSLIYSPSVAMKMSRKYRAPELKSLVNAEEFSDVAFMLDDGRRVFANRGILSKRSEYFRALFNPGREHMRMLESNAKEVAIHGVGHAIFVAILEYLYCGEVSITEATAIDLVKAADLFMLDTLKSTVADFLIEHTTTESVLSLLQLADQRGLPALKDHCKSFLINILRHQPNSEIRHRFLEFISPLNRDLILELTLQPCLTGTGAACVDCARMAASQASQAALAASTALPTLPPLPSLPTPGAVSGPPTTTAAQGNTTAAPAPPPRPDPIALPNRQAPILPLSPTTSTIRERQIGEPPHATLGPRTVPPTGPAPAADTATANPLASPASRRSARAAPPRTGDRQRPVTVSSTTPGGAASRRSAGAQQPRSSFPRLPVDPSRASFIPSNTPAPASSLSNTNRLLSPLPQLSSSSSSSSPAPAAHSASSSSAPRAASPAAPVASSLGVRMASAALDVPMESQNSQIGDGLDGDGAQPGAADPAPRTDAETDADGDADMEPDRLSAAAANGHESDIQSPNTPSPPANASAAPAGPSVFDVEAANDSESPAPGANGSAAAGAKRRRVGAPPSPSTCDSLRCD